MSVSSALLRSKTPRDYTKLLQDAVRGQSSKLHQTPRDRDAPSAKREDLEDFVRQVWFSRRANAMDLAAALASSQKLQLNLEKALSARSPSDFLDFASIFVRPAEHDAPLHADQRTPPPTIVGPLVPASVCLLDSSAAVLDRFAVLAQGPSARPLATVVAAFGKLGVLDRDGVLEAAFAAATKVKKWNAHDFSAFLYGVSKASGKVREFHWPGAARKCLLPMLVDLEGRFETVFSDQEYTGTASAVRADRVACARNLSNILFALAEWRVRPEALVSKAFVLLETLAETTLAADPLLVLQLVRSLGVLRPGLAGGERPVQLQTEAVEKILFLSLDAASASVKRGSWGPREVSTFLWSLCCVVADGGEHSTLALRLREFAATIFKQAGEERDTELPSVRNDAGFFLNAAVEDLRMLLRVALVLDEKSLHTCCLDRLRVLDDAQQRSFHTVSKSQSRFGALLRAGLQQNHHFLLYNVQEEAFLEELWRSVDFLVECKKPPGGGGSRKFIVEFEGPTHYFRLPAGRAMGSTILEGVVARRAGFEVLCVPHFVVDALLQPEHYTPPEVERARANFQKLVEVLSSSSGA